MQSKIIWQGGLEKDTRLGKQWETEPYGATVRVTVCKDYNYACGKYSLRTLIKEHQEIFHLVEINNGWLIDTKAILGLLSAPIPSWFQESVVPVQPVLREEQCYLEPDDWFYTIRIDLNIMANDFPEKVEEYDAFVVHATEDKSDFVRPLVFYLRSMGFKIWFDEFEIKLGDSIRQSIDYGLTHSNFGIAVISKGFLKKKWPQYELNGLITREMSGVKTVLPIWYDITFEEVMKYSQSIADKSAAKGSAENIEEVANEIAEILRSEH